MNTKAADRRAPLTVALCFLVALVEGFDIQSMGVAAPTLGPALKLSREALGPVFSASVFGLFLGAAVLGRAADIVGRKWTLVVSLAVFGVFSIATAFAHDLPTLLWIRVLTGLGLGGAMPNIISLASECAPPQRRASVVTLMTSGLPFGGAVASAVSAAWGWKEIFYLGGAAPLLLIPLVAFGMPESRAFLDRNARRKEHGGRRASSLHVLFGGGRALTTLLLWIAFFFTLLVLYLLLNWLPLLMQSKGIASRDASLVSLLFNIGGGIGTIVLAVLLDRGRRWPLITLSYAGMAAGLAGLAFAGADLAASAAAGAAAGFFVIGAQLALYGLAPEFYATEMRGTGVGAAVALGRLGAVAGPMLAAALLAASSDTTVVLLAILPVVAVGGITALLLLSRPKAAHD